ncbi:hypothetical protein Smp_131820 [Schistosoma mansoni]|uniref:hypothetical protein n=1 Tax=Schistosoma mansoni TaxID=6183 RepID=UPI00022C8761|nr:hypothetical protein Smp_131820 [Schistosoma mansoni]|eukprot:XP_018645507.1 hypothetical protein Smp_131820 [Schistosoma mansoni]
MHSVYNLSVFFVLANNPSFQLALLYVANEILTKSPKYGVSEFGEALKPVVTQATQFLKPGPFISKLTKLINYWTYRKVFDIKFTEQLLQKINATEQAGKKNITPPSHDNKADNIVKNFNLDEICESHGKFDISPLGYGTPISSTVSSLKSKEESRSLTGQVDKCCKHLEFIYKKYEERLEHMNALQSILEGAEIYYNVQLKEVAIVVNPTPFGFPIFQPVCDASGDVDYRVLLNATLPKSVKTDDDDNNNNSRSEMIPTSKLQDPTVINHTNSSEVNPINSLSNIPKMNPHDSSVVVNTNNYPHKFNSSHKTVYSTYTRSNNQNNKDPVNDHHQQYYHDKTINKTSHTAIDDEEDNMEVSDGEEPSDRTNENILDKNVNPNDQSDICSQQDKDWRIFTEVKCNIMKPVNCLTGTVPDNNPTNPTISPNNPVVGLTMPSESFIQPTLPRPPTSIRIPPPPAPPPFVVGGLDSQHSFSPPPPLPSTLNELAYHQHHILPVTKSDSFIPQPPAPPPMLLNLQQINTIITSGASSSSSDTSSELTKSSEHNIQQSLIMNSLNSIKNLPILSKLDSIATSSSSSSSCESNNNQNVNKKLIEDPFAVISRLTGLSNLMKNSDLLRCSIDKKSLSSSVSETSINKAAYCENEEQPKFSDLDKINSMNSSNDSDSSPGGGDTPTLDERQNDLLLSGNNDKDRPLISFNPFGTPSSSLADFLIPNSCHGTDPKSFLSNIPHSIISQTSITPSPIPSLTSGYRLPFCNLSNSTSIPVVNPMNIPSTQLSMIPPTVLTANNNPNLPISNSQVALGLTHSNMMFYDPITRMPITPRPLVPGPFMISPQQTRPVATVPAQSNLQLPTTLFRGQNWSQSLVNQTTSLQRPPSNDFWALMSTVPPPPPPPPPPPQQPPTLPQPPTLSPFNQTQIRQPLVGGMVFNPNSWMFSSPTSTNRDKK